MQPSPARDVNIASTEALISPVGLVEELPLTADVEAVVLEGRRQIQAVLRGEDSRFLVITGPCSVHDEEAGLEYAQRLKALQDEYSDRMLIVMRVYFEKPRTTVGWKGMIYDPYLNDTFDIGEGLRRARRLLLKIGEMGIYTATEFLDPIVPQYLAGLVSWAAIGARTTESQTHRQMASGLSMPVGFKNGTDGDAQIAVDAMLSAQSEHAFLGIDHFGQTCIVHTNGNPYGHLVLRGGKSGSNFRLGVHCCGSGTAEQGGRAIAAAGRLQPRQLQQGPYAAEHRAELHYRAAHRRERRHHRLHAGEQPECGQPESQRNPRGTGVWRVSYGRMHRLGGDGRAASRGV